MKQIFLILFTFGLLSCIRQTENIQLLQNRVDSLESQLANTYKPGFGEFMSSIQVHHNKLWFAGQNQNWKLADFEINEIKESLDGIKKYCSDRPETNSIGIIEEPLQNVTNAILQKNITFFFNFFFIFINSFILNID